MNQNEWINIMEANAEKSVVYRNGINVSEYEEIVDAVSGDASLARFNFRVSNKWIDGGLNRTSVGGFYGAGADQGVSDRSFSIDADEPPILLGNDTAPNPVEFLLHALAACLTSTIVYKAAERGLVIESIESELDGDMDARSFLEISDEERRGFQSIRARLKIRSSASARELEDLSSFSPVYDIVSNATPVIVAIEPA